MQAPRSVFSKLKGLPCLAGFQMGTQRARPLLPKLKTCMGAALLRRTAHGPGTASGSQSRPEDRDGFC